MHKIYFDGGTRLNSVCIYDEELKFYDVTKMTEPMTNNQLEYTALYAAILYAYSKYLLRDCCFIGDSELIIRQMQGEYVITNPILKILNKKVTNYIAKVDEVPPVVSMFKWVRREENLAGIYLENIG